MKTMPATLILLLLAASVIAAEPPTRIDTDGPAEGVVPLQLQELWRAGGEDGDILFGRISDVAGDADGNVYVLDNQLCQVEVFGPDGEHLRTLSRQGEGPGEVQQPIGVVLLPDDLVGIGAGFPGKMVTLRRDGTPVATRYPIGEPSDGNIGVMISLGTGGGVLAATGGRLVFDDPDHSHAERFLAVGDAAGGQYTRILEKQTPLDPTGRFWDEAADYYFDGRWDLGADGLIYVPVHRDRYLVSVYDRDGQLQRAFGRNLDQRKRTDGDKRQVGPIINVNGQRTDDEWKICDTDPAISRVMLNPSNGNVWVLTPQGSTDLPEGVVEMWDVFSPEGEYLRQVTIPDGGEIREATGFLVGGDRLLLVRGSGSRFLRDDEAPDEEEDEPEPLEVICYRIDQH